MKSVTDSWIPTFTFFQYRYVFRGAMPGISVTYQMISEYFVFEDVIFFSVRFDLAQISGPSRAGFRSMLKPRHGRTRTHVGLGQASALLTAL